MNGARLKSYMCMYLQLPQAPIQQTTHRFIYLFAMPSLQNLAIAIVASSAIGFAQAKACPPLGRVLPAPQAPSKNNAVQEAVGMLKSSLNATLSQSMVTSGISVAVKSTHEDKLLFNYHYTPPVLSDIGTSAIDEHTIYRVGSVLKMMPSLSALQSSEIDMHASVLKYLPRLANNSDARDSIHRIPWEDISVADLATHLSGLPRDSTIGTFFYYTYGFISNNFVVAFDLALLPTGPWTKMGLPAVRNGTGPTCSGLPGTKKMYFERHHCHNRPQATGRTSWCYTTLLQSCLRSARCGCRSCYREEIRRGG